MSYLPSEDPEMFRKETWGVFWLSVLFIIVLGVIVYFTDGIVVKA